MVRDTYPDGSADARADRLNGSARDATEALIKGCWDITLKTDRSSRPETDGTRLTAAAISVPDPLRTCRCPGVS